MGGEREWWGEPAFFLAVADDWGDRERVGESIWWSRLFAFFARGGNHGGLRGGGRVVGAVGREVDEKTGDGMLMGWVGVFRFWGRVGGVEIGGWVWMGERGMDGGTREWKQGRIVPREFIESLWMAEVGWRRGV